MIIYQSINGKDLDGEFLWPFYAAVEKLGVPLSVHGVDSGPLLGVERFASDNLDFCLGFPFEVFTAISALILVACLSASQHSNLVSLKLASAGYPGSSADFFDLKQFY